MKIQNLKLANNLGLIDASVHNKKDLIKRLSDLLKNKIDADNKNFDGFNVFQCKYNVSNGTGLNSYDEMISFINNPANKEFQVYPVYVKQFDMALEGGGTFGFAHIGAVHAYAMKCIGADRFAGTSAGAIVAALLAAGYQVDLNYKPDTLKAVRELVPDPNHSLNKILFESNLAGFSDIPTSEKEIKELVRNSFLSKILRDLLQKAIDIFITSHYDKIKIDISTLKDKITDIILSIIKPLTNWDPWPFDFNDKTIFDTIKKPIEDAADNIVRIVNSGITLVENIHKKIITAVGNILIALLDEVLIIIMLWDGKINMGMLSFLRILELGGLWEGTAIRDWVERHLQQKCKGSGLPLNGTLDGTIRRPKIRKKNAYAKAILFKDLPDNLCITATAVGLPGENFSTWKDGLIYFSKKTSPDYPVAEAVRRSLSLPYVFIPRKLSDGYTNNAKVFKTSDYDPNQFASIKKLSLFNFQGMVKLNFNPLLLEPIHPIPSGLINISSPATTNDTDSANKNSYGTVNNNIICQDGGFIVNIPLGVFRDKDNEIFDCPVNKSGEFTKTVIVSNLNQSSITSPRPYDIPVPQSNLPINLTLDENDEGPVLHGIDKLKLITFNLINYSPLGEWKQYEIDMMIDLIPNLIVADCKLLDPVENDTRLSGLTFDMATTTKKWMLKSGFEGARVSLEEIIEQKPILKNFLKIDTNIDPYLHIVRLTELKINQNTDKKSMFVPAAFEPGNIILHDGGESPLLNGSSIFTDEPGIKLIETPLNLMLSNRLGKILDLGNGNKIYEGAGYTLVKTQKSKSNIENANSNWMSFRSNLKVQVTVLLKEQPVFLDGFIADPFFRCMLKGMGSANISLIAISKIFEAGEIIVPGARKFNPNNATISPIVLVRPV